MLILIGWLRWWLWVFSTVESLSPTPLLSYCILRKEVTQYSQPTLKEWGVQLHLLKGRVSNIHSVKFFCLGDLSGLAHSFMCATIDFCQCWLMLSIVLRVCSFFVAGILLALATGSCFRLTPVSLSLLPLCVCVCVHFLTVWFHKIFQPHCVYVSILSRISHFSKEPWFLFTEGWF